MSLGAAAEALPALALDERDAEPRTPMKRLGSTRKLAAFNNIRLQLTEQTRVLESRAEAAAGIATELHEYCKRRADLEHEYARALDKLARVALQRQKDQKHKREVWALTGAFAIWQTVLENTRILSRDHSALAELYGGRLASRLQRAAEDALRLHRKCKDIVQERHEEVGGALAEAGAAGKAHLAAAAEWRAAATKLRHAYDQRQRVAGADPPRVKKLKSLDKELEKRRQRHSEARSRALRARSDYTLCLDAANATMHRYYLDDIADIMLCMEVGFDACVGRAVRTAAAADAARAHSICSAANSLLDCLEALDSAPERQRYLDAHAQVFTLPRRISFLGIAPEQEVGDSEIASTLGDAAGPDGDVAADTVGSELAARLVQLEATARALRAECRENAKTLDAAEDELIQQMEGTDDQWDITGLFGTQVAANAAGAVIPGEDAPPPPSDTPRKEQEDYYLSKFRSYVCSAGRLARLESKASTLRARLLPTIAPGRLPPPPPPDTHTDIAFVTSHSRRRRGGAGGRGQFAASLDDHLAATRRDLPLVLTSCVRVIASYGIRHQGIFRVSGSQVEMQSLRAAFERGEDPLMRVRDATDINSVAGLLKLYLRELRPPLLSPLLLERLVRIAAMSDEDFVIRMRELVLNLPTSSMLVLRYLFAFFAHLSEHQDENMMDAWNLAICVGPTLLAAYGEGGGAQVHAQNLVNELVKRTILAHMDVFPQDIAPHAIYRRAQFCDNDNNDNSDKEAEAQAERAEASSGSGGDEDGARALPEPDANDDLSLYDDDDEDISDDGDNGDWREQEPARSQRCGSGEARAEGHAAAQVAELCAAAAAPPSPPERKSSVTAASHRLAEATPDLVLDLPARAAASALPASPALPVPLPVALAAPPPLDPAAPAHDPAPVPLDAEPTGTADTFLHNRDTLKKRPRRRQTASEEGTDAGLPDEEERSLETPASGSPVPARNTARVAAKFAELTLTGGSLKPALAAKPAMMRRATPHPHPAPAPVPPTAPAPHTAPAPDPPV